MSQDLSTRYRDIADRVLAASAAAGAAGRVTLLAVGKTQPVEAIAELYALGHRDFGENYVQELLEKAEKLESMGCAGIRWHFIGHLQTNKVKALLPRVHAIHSVDSEKLALEISKRWAKLHGSDAAALAGARLPCFLEVNIDREESKAGVPPERAAERARAIASTCPGIALQGLMAIPAAGDPEQARASFRALRALERECRPATAGKLSMGMSGDYEIAIAEGATHVRVGTALFGERQR